MKTRAIEPYLWIFSSVEYSGPGELLIMGRIAIRLQTSIDKCALLFGQPAYALRVV